ncbi:MAG: SUF system NifU family Fe-S cluster assembly protein [Propionibacteriaceae bacterium]|jgi:nitrogen fixation NifU-like protein|nr:SUF system NifU family Fe-S cluster assembly protein [Propionibacteriaceae bacterium]
MDDASVEAMYQEIILDHYRRKSHSGLREPFSCQVGHVNPTCGDEVELRVRLDGDTVADVSYEAVGCAISQASTSVMSDLVIGQTVDGAFAAYDAFHKLMDSQGVVDDLDAAEAVLGDGVAFVGVAKFPARVKCALLGWSAFRDAALQAIEGGAGSAKKESPHG